MNEKGEITCEHESKAGLLETIVVLLCRSILESMVCTVGMNKGGDYPLLYLFLKSAAAALAEWTDCHPQITEIRRAFKDTEAVTFSQLAFGG